MSLSYEAQEQFQSFTDGETPLEQFETWLYENGEWLTEELGDEDYVELVSIDFAQKDARVRLREMVQQILEEKGTGEASHQPYLGSGVDRRPPQAKIEEIRELLRSYYARASDVEVRRETSLIPHAMRANSTGREARWSLVDSTVTSREISALEAMAPMQLPASVRAYLFAYCHFFDQVRSDHHDQLVLLPVLSTRDPLAATRELLDAWHPLVGSGYFPIATWGDGWGPICLDGSSETKKVPLVWFDHEVIADVSDWHRRDAVTPHADRIYESFDQMLDDLFLTPLGQ